MQKNNIVFIIWSVVIAIIIVIVFSQSPTSQKKSVSNISVPLYTSSSISEKPVSSAYSLIEVKKHNSISDCWSAVNGGVYNLTSWIRKHQGGEKTILSICGKDGSLAFNNQHEEKRKINKILETFKIGIFVQ